MRESCSLSGVGPVARHRFLITGGAGFIGSHLAERLLASGFAVEVLDDLSTGRLDNIRTLLGHSHFEFVRGSVEDAELMETLMSRCDAAFHLAATLGVELVIQQPIRAMWSIIRGVENFLNAAHHYGRPCLLTSSSEVYGKGSRIPFAEDDDVVMGATRESRWCYGYSKGIGEFLALAYHRQFALPVTVVRLFNTVGPRQVGTFGMVLPRFVEAALRGQPLWIYGDGKQSRCFCHVQDVVGAMIRLLEMPTATAGEVYNLGNDEEVTIVELAQRIIQLADSSSAIEFLPYERATDRGYADVSRRVPKLDKLRAAISYQPSYNLTQIIQSVIDCTELCVKGAAYTSECALPSSG